MRAEQILAFRYSRSCLGERETSDLASAVDCPASDFTRDAALTAIAARIDGVRRDTFDDAVERGALVLAHVMRGAIHVVAPEDHALFGRLLIADHDDELARQVGHHVTELCEGNRIRLVDALAEVTFGVRDALVNGRRLSKDDLHTELRGSVREELLPYCKGCQSHHVPPMLWRYATANAGARLGADRRYVLAPPGHPPPAHEAVHRYLRWYGPATPGEFSEWAGVSPSHGRRLWDEIADELVEVSDPAGRAAWTLAEDLEELNDPPPPQGIRLLPPGDPFLWRSNRAMLVPDDAQRRQVFKPVGSPGAVLANGRLVGLWRVRGRAGATELTVEPTGRLRKAAVEVEAQRLAEARGDADATVTVGRGRPDAGS